MTGNAVACGGVVLDDQGCILLREPSRHFDGYVWTFAKGRPNQGETEGQTALRETWEETGVQAQFVGRIPGTFPGGTTDNIYFLMRRLRETGKWDEETARVFWATPEKAREMIGLTTNSVGRARDLAVLDAALALGREMN